MAVILLLLERHLLLLWHRIGAWVTALPVIVGWAVVADGLGLVMVMTIARRARIVETLGWIPLLHVVALLIHNVTVAIVHCHGRLIVARHIAGIVEVVVTHRIIHRIDGSWLGSVAGR